MERNSLIPWKYSRWQGTFMGLVFIGFGIAFYFKNNFQFQYVEIAMFGFGIGGIIYAWTGLYDRWRRKRGYYEEDNPPFMYNILQMVGQVIGFAVMISFTFINRDVALSLLLGGLALMAIGGASLFIARSKKTKVEIWRGMSYYIIRGAVLVLIITGLLWVFFVLDNSKYEYLNLIFVPLLFLVVGVFVFRLKAKR